MNQCFGRSQVGSILQPLSTLNLPKSVYITMILDDDYLTQFMYVIMVVLVLLV